MNIRTAPGQVVESAAGGLKVGATLTDGLIVDCPPATFFFGVPNVLLAARIVGDEFDGQQVGLWAVRAPGLCVAVDETARDWTTWGERFPSDGTDAAERERLANCDEARAVRAAVLSAGSG